MVVKRGNLLVPLDRNPLEIYLLALCVLSGTVSGIHLAAGGQPPNHVPLLIAWVFYALITAGGAGGIAGAFWRDTITGVLIVRAAMIPTSAGALAYAITVLHGGAALAALSVAGLAVACGWRAWEITRHVRDVNRALAALPPEAPAGGEPS